jgi:rare lipoprotein A
MKKRKIVVGLSLLIAIIFSGCVTKTAKVIDYNNKVSTSPKTKKLKFKRVTYGKASWYGKKYDGKKTASGEIFYSNKKTAAHKTLPFNTMVRVTDIVSNRSDIVRINDRGPFVGNRIIDISYASAKKLGLVKQGITDVKVEIVGSDGKVDRRLVLPVSKKACIGDSCLTNIVKIDRELSRVKPFSILSKSYSSIDRDPYLSTHSANSYPKKVSVQVGAFRNYAGADIYKREYSILNSNYKAVIKNGKKDAKPIYRVQVEGFRNESEARRFISEYKSRLNGAFLVRK